MKTLGKHNKCQESLTESYWGLPVSRYKVQPEPEIKPAEAAGGCGKVKGQGLTYCPKP